jgi:hypothetical protein
VAEEHFKRTKEQNEMIEVSLDLALCQSPIPLLAFELLSFRTAVVVCLGYIGS